MKNINEFLKLVKLEPLLVNYTDINPKGSIYHRLNGKSTRGDKPKEITDQDKIQLADGLKKFVADTEIVIKSLEVEPNKAIDEAG